jgi:hypothetical protein
LRDDAHVELTDFEFLTRTMSPRVWGYIEAAALAAHAGNHEQAERFRQQAGFGGLDDNRYYS